jgi:hypothetical protein
MAEMMEGLMPYFHKNRVCSGPARTIRRVGFLPRSVSGENPLQHCPSEALAT